MVHDEKVISGVISILLVIMNLAIISFIRKVLLTSFNLQKIAENSARSVENMMNALPDSVLLCSENGMQSTDSLIYQGTCGK
jgi:predicted ABC-type sugar transport system permease subunit